MAKATKSAGRINKAQKGNQKPQDARKAANPTGTAPKEAKPQKGNPFREHGGYWSAVEALRSLGIGRLHDFKAIVPAYRKAMGAAWKKFATRKGCEMDADKRALTNVMVTARADYGKPLRDIGYEVRWDGREKKAGLFRVSK